MMELPVQIPSAYGLVRGLYSKPKGCTDAVILLPGLSGGALSSRFRFISLALAEAGIGCLSLEFSAYAKGGFDSYALINLLEELKGANAFLKADGIKNIGLVAKSFSGILAVLDWEDFKSLVLIAPTVFIKRKGMYDVDEIFKTEFGKLEIGKIGFTNAHLEEIKIPLRIIHGTEDEVVDIRNSERIIKLCRGNLVVIVGADHSFYLEEHKRDLASKVVEWFENSL